jgi:signal transduction histidine kinase
VSIKRRVRMLGGELMLESRPGQGASLEIRVPLN